MSRNAAAVPFAELLERRTDDAAALHHAVSSHPDVRQVASDDAVIHDDRLKTQRQNGVHWLSKQKKRLIQRFNEVLRSTGRCVVRYFAYFPIQDDVLTPA